MLLVPLRVLLKGPGLVGETIPGAFVPTSWSLLLRAAEGEPVQRREALEELAQLYWKPVYAYLRRKGKGSDTAGDLAQGFFAHVLEKNLLARARRERGRFRSYLLALLEHHLANKARKRGAKKRASGPGIDAKDVVHDARITGRLSWAGRESAAGRRVSVRQAKPGSRG
ncbi:MAG: hypothetical protein HY720_30440 [Planctomycetes bacterium]|nr:hypothetical protein [Planctomycetota bacterium]